MFNKWIPVNRCWRIASDTLSVEKIRVKAQLGNHNNAISRPSGKFSKCLRAIIKPTKKIGPKTLGKRSITGTYLMILMLLGLLAGRARQEGGAFFAGPLADDVDGDVGLAGDGGGAAVEVSGGLVDE